MDKKITITIGREFGAEGHEIAEALAKRLNFPFYDKDMLSLAAKKSGIDINTLSLADESISSRFLSPYLTVGKLSNSISSNLFRIQTQIIHDLSSKGSVIIIGRAADYILKDDPNCLKVFIYAPFEKRVEIIKNKHCISEVEARHLVKKMDAARNNYYHYYSTGKWNQKEDKDLLLNRAVFSVSSCVEIILSAVEEFRKR